MCNEWHEHIYERHVAPVRGMATGCNGAETGDNPSKCLLRRVVPFVTQACSSYLRLNPRGGSHTMTGQNVAGW